MIEPQWTGCFEDVTDAQAERIIEAMQGLPDNVVAFVQQHVRFAVQAGGSIISAHAIKAHAYNCMTIRLFGVDGRHPVPPLVVWHEIAHCYAGDPYRPYARLRNRMPLDAKHRIEERRAWLLLAQWGKAWGDREATPPPPAPKLPMVAEALHNERIK